MPAGMEDEEIPYKYDDDGTCLILSNVMNQTGAFPSNEFPKEKKKKMTRAELRKVDPKQAKWLTWREKAVEQVVREMFERDKYGLYFTVENEMNIVC